MKNPFVKPTMLTFKYALSIFLILLVSSPFFALFITFFNPSVAEATNPQLGECDIYYNDVYYPCNTIGEAIKINFFLSVFISIVAFIVILFSPIKEGIF